tara:strand:- start:1378 stop:1623 length:246 start_codon:yes stop_codon:yes gene_type:complete
MSLKDRVKALWEAHGLRVPPNETIPDYEFASRLSPKDHITLTLASLGALSGVNTAVDREQIAQETIALIQADIIAERLKKN